MNKWVTGAMAAQSIHRLKIRMRLTMSQLQNQPINIQQVEKY